MGMKKEYTAIVHKEREGNYWAEVPELPGCYTEGDTLEELKTNLREAIALYIEDGDEEREDAASVLQVAM